MVAVVAADCTMAGAKMDFFASPLRMRACRDRLLKTAANRRRRRQRAVNVGEEMRTERSVDVNTKKEGE